jgi:hypothetical protein
MSPISLAAGKRSAFLALWILWPLEFWYASTYSDAQNQIHWAYTFGLCGIAAVLFPSTFVSRGLVELVSLIALYILTFFIGSFWELYPGTALGWLRFDIVQIPVAINFYVLGRVFDQERIIEALHWLGVVVVLLTIPQLFLGGDLARFGYGVQLMLCLPASMALRKYWFVAIALAVMFASLHKTSLAGAILGIGLAFLFMKHPKERMSVQSHYLRAAYSVVALFALFGAVIALTTQIAEMVGRFLPESLTGDFLGVQVIGEQVDIARVLVTSESFNLLPKYAIQGMGYMNFAVFLGLESGHVETTRLGQEFLGINLHNSYMTWILEGGLLVTGAVIFLFIRTGKRMRWLWRSSEFHNFGVLTVGWAAACLLLAGFQQLHFLMQFWGSIGLIFGVYDRAKRFGGNGANRHRATSLP